MPKPYTLYGGTGPKLKFLPKHRGAATAAAAPPEAELLLMLRYSTGFLLRNLV